MYPGFHLTRIQAERHCCVEAERGILTVVIVRSGLAALDGTVADGIHHAEARHDFATWVESDGEITVGSFFDHFDEALRCTKQGRKRRPEGGRHFPADFRIGLSNYGCGHRSAGHSTKAGLFKK